MPLEIAVLVVLGFGPPITAPRIPIPPASTDTDSSASELGLTRQDDGSFLYLDPGGRFSARIDPDGRVAFADRWRRPDARGRRRARPERGHCCGAPAEGVLRAVAPFTGAGVPGPTEWAFAAKKHDPVAAAKGEMLTKTQSFRTRLAMAWHKDVIAMRLRALPRELDKLWADETLSAAERRRRIFARWDECDDAMRAPVAEDLDPGPGLVTARADAATRARAAIERFVRNTLPRSSAVAYSAEELTRLNAARVSATRFDPYQEHER